jgi:hypothetical protein
VYKTLPKETMQDLIIHKRYVQAGMVQPTAGTKTFVVEATLLHDGGREHANYQKADPITKWVNRSKTNLVVSQLELQFPSQTNVYMPQNANPFLSQEVTNPYFAYFNKDHLNSFSNMGYGLNQNL